MAQVWAWAALITILDPTRCSLQGSRLVCLTVHRLRGCFMFVCRHEDKYYGSAADQVQDWLVLTPDPTVDVSRHGMKAASSSAI